VTQISDNPMEQSPDYTGVWGMWRWQSSILEVRSRIGADCDTDHYLVVAKVRERLAVSKQGGRKFDGERFKLRKLNELEFRKQYQIEITNRFAALENLSDGEDVNRGGRTLTHCGRVTQICVFNTVKLGTSASSP